MTFYTQIQTKGHPHPYALTLCKNFFADSSRLTNLKLRPDSSRGINAWLAEQVEWAMLLMHFSASPAVCHQCIDWHIRSGVPPFVQQGNGIMHIASQGWPMFLTPYWIGTDPYACGTHLLQSVPVGRADGFSCLKPHLCIHACSCMS